jgi:hypothetical protein
LVSEPIVARVRYRRFKFDHLAGGADLRLTTTANRQTLVNAQSARVVNFASAADSRTDSSNPILIPKRSIH